MMIHGVSYSASIWRIPTMCWMLFQGDHDPDSRSSCSRGEQNKKCEEGIRSFNIKDQNEGSRGVIENESEKNRTF